jgi:hypothetical protein
MASAFVQEEKSKLFHFLFRDDIKEEEYSFTIPGNTPGEAFSEILGEDDVREWLAGYLLFLQGFGDDDYDEEDFTEEMVLFTKEIVSKILNGSATPDEIEIFVDTISYGFTDEKPDERPFWLCMEEMDVNE